MSLNLVHERSAFEKLNKVSASCSVFPAMPRAPNAPEAPRNRCCSSASSRIWLQSGGSLDRCFDFDLPSTRRFGGCSHIINICSCRCILRQEDWKLLRRQLFISGCRLRWIGKISLDYSNFAEIAEEQHYQARTLSFNKDRMLQLTFVWLYCKF